MAWAHTAKERASAAPVAAILLTGALLYFFFNFFIGLSKVLFGYYLVLAVVAIFLFNPYVALLTSIFFKPLIDLFWYSKFEGLVSPLFIAGVTIPFMAFILRKKVTEGRAVKGPADFVIFAYLAVFGLLTVLKIINAPEYAFNSIDSYSRILSVTLFYFIGKYYFRTPGPRSHLAWVILCSSIIPFALTLSQQAAGRDLSLFRDVARYGAKSAFYMQGSGGIVRISGMYEGVYELAFLGVFTSLVLLAILMSRVKVPAVAYALMPLGLYFLYFTFSRSAWAMFAVSIVIFFTATRKKLLTVLSLAVFTVLYLFIPAVSGRFGSEVGFLQGETPFSKVGYGRGMVWTMIFDQFLALDPLRQLIGSYGLGNAENQFIGLTIWFGYIGLFTFLVLITYLTVTLWRRSKEIPRDGSFDANCMLMFTSMLIASYWFAGLGNQFNVMISTQWVLWTWTGAILGARESSLSGQTEQPRSR